MTYPTLGIVTEDSAIFVARITCIGNDIQLELKGKQHVLNAVENTSFFMVLHLTNLSSGHMIVKQNKN